jgi:hypothetical protein
MVVRPDAGNRIKFRSSPLREVPVNKLVFAFLVLVLSAGAALQKPIPPGLRQAERAEQEGEQNVPQPANAPVKPSFAEVQRDADQLALLARTLPDEVSQLTKGIRPRDLDEKLKEIDKLSRRLRSKLRRM